MKKIMLTILAIAAVAILASLLSPSPPILRANPDDGGFGCPKGDDWTGPVSASNVIPSIDRGDFTDYNGDGNLCFRVPKGFCENRGQGDGAPVCAAFIWKDNDN